MKYYFLAKIFVSIKLPDPIHETGFPKLSFITILYLKFRCLVQKRFTTYSNELMGGGEVKN